MPKVEVSQIKSDFYDLNYNEKQLELYDFFYKARKIAETPIVSSDDKSPQNQFLGDALFAPPSPSIERSVTSIASFGGMQGTGSGFGFFNSLKKQIKQLATQAMSPARTKLSSPKDDQLHEAYRQTYTNGYLQQCAEQLEYIEMTLKYQLEEFSFYVADRIHFKPYKTTYLRAIFFTKPESLDYVEVFVGLVRDKEVANKLLYEGTDDPDGNSMFDLTIRFDERLI